MRHSIFTICLVLLTFNKVYCQNKTSIENSIFWQVVSDTKKDTSYIFGTVHLIDKARFYLPSEVLNALSKCKALYLEVNEDPDPAELLALTRLKNESIFDFLSPEQKDSVLNFSENTLKIDSETFSNFYAGFKPFVFTQLPLEAILGTTMSYDLEIKRSAKNANLSINGLETFEEQIEIFDNIPPKMVPAFIMETIREEENSLQAWEKIQSGYLNQNLQDFLSNFDLQNPLDQYLYRELIQKRNKNWVKTLSPIFKKQKTFVAVGAAHLAGDDGLLQLLQSRGFQISPITINLKP